MKKLLAAFAATLLVLNPMQASEVKSATYGKMPDGREVKLFTLTNENGYVARVSEYGAILVSMEVPTEKGKRVDVTLGYDTHEGWLTNTNYFGSTVGRFGNRIGAGKFTLDGKTYQLATNNQPNDVPCHLHGGEKGFDKVLWSGAPVNKPGASGVALTYVAKDGEEGYPGNLTTVVTYWLTEKDELIWEVSATTDKATIVNLAHHTYWNLTGDATKSINDHELMIEADAYLPTDKGLIPTGELAPVEGTPMDFRKPTKIGARADEAFEALKFAGGYDHCWVLRKGDGLRRAAVVKDPASGRTMEVYTDQPGIQFYGGNFLDGTVTGKNGVNYKFRTGLCLETQNFPDAPNKANFPSAVLRPGETYRHTLVHRFTK